MSRFFVLNLWERKVFAGQCSHGTHMGTLIPSTCHLLYNGDLDELLQKRKAVNA